MKLNVVKVSLSLICDFFWEIYSGKINTFFFKINSQFLLQTCAKHITIQKKLCFSCFAFRPNISTAHYCDSTAAIAAPKMEYEYKNIQSACENILLCTSYQLLLLNETCSSGFVVAGLPAGFVTPFFASGRTLLEIDRQSSVILHARPPGLSSSSESPLRCGHTALSSVLPTKKNRVSHVEVLSEAVTRGASIRQPIWINKQEVVWRMNLLWR